MGGIEHPPVTVDPLHGTILIGPDRIGTTAVTTRVAWFSTVPGDPLLALFAETIQGGTGVRRTRFVLFRRSGGVWRDVTRRLMPRPSLEDFFAKPAPGEHPLPLAYDQGAAEAFPRFVVFAPAAATIILSVVPSYLPGLLSPDDADAVARFEAARRLRLVYRWERVAGAFRLQRTEPDPGFD
jgi:hypothetical protein